MAVLSSHHAGFDEKRAFGTSYTQRVAKTLRPVNLCRDREFPTHTKYQSEHPLNEMTMIVEMPEPNPETLTPPLPATQTTQQ